MFSRRVPADLAANRVSQAIARARAEGRPIIDLTLSNPTRAGIEYPVDLLAPLGHPRALVYDPSPFGSLGARTAVAEDYARRRIQIIPERIVLTASTSEAYSLLFKLLLDPGDDVLIPRPSYPLFEHLASLDAVAARPYDLEYHGVWSIDFTSIERALTPRTRAVLVVSPNNPTGSFVKQGELARLAHLCRDRDIALIGDEVFADYKIEPATGAASVLGSTEALTFSLGGLSKSIGLPQAKLGWIGVTGPAHAVAEALQRLELVCDTYLSVSTPVQAAAAELLAAGCVVRDRIRRRVRANYERLKALTPAKPSCCVLKTEGGWSAVLQVPSFCSEEELVLGLLEEESVLVHPGYFFDFARQSYLILSLLVPEEAFRAGAERVLVRSS